jgi:adenylylsulfate kinase
VFRKMFKIYWLTGLPCSGKTTIANELAKRIHAEILDGDDIRAITNNKDFSPEGRRNHMLSVAELAYRLSKYNNVVVALVSPIKSVRDEIKKKYPNVNEIYVKCSLEGCKKRDVKGMYNKALKGEIKDFTGISAPYEAPEHSTVIDTEHSTIQECASLIVAKHHKPERYSFFIGRWQPLHDGHLTLFNEIKKEGKKLLIGIRNTGIDESNPYSVNERIEMIREKVPEAETIVLPDIEAVCFGRKVGYDIREIKLSNEIESISATKIREKNKNN